MKSRQSVFALPNIITYSRFALIIPVLYFLNTEHYWAATMTALLAFLTDFLDGRIARLTNRQTALGALLDPIADKVLALTFMSCFVWMGHLNAAYFYLSATRDILQLLAIPVLLGWKRIPFKVEPKFLPKLATSLKFIILSLLFVKLFTGVNSFYSFWPLLLGISAALEVYVLLTFLPRFAQIYKGKHDTFE